MPVLKFLMLLIAVIVIIASSKFVLRKIFNIKKVKKKVFSYNHLNKNHRIVDWAVRLIALTLYVILAYQLYFNDFSFNLFLIIMTLTVTSENFVRAYFEWKASPDPKQSILSLGEGVILLTIILGIIQFDVLNILFK